MFELYINWHHAIGFKKRTVVVLRSVIDDQEVGETEVVIQVRLDPFLPIDITLNPMA
jgi:hypothetical protein